MADAEAERLIREALARERAQPAQPQMPPHKHKSEILDGGWTINPGLNQEGMPVVIIQAADMSEDIIYQFSDMMVFVNFKLNCEKVIEARNQSNGQS